MSPPHKKHINNPTPNSPPTTTTYLSQQPPKNGSRSRSKAGSKNYHHKPPRATTAKSPPTTTNQKPTPPWKPAVGRITRVTAATCCYNLLKPHWYKGRKRWGDVKVVPRSTTIIMVYILKKRLWIWRKGRRLGLEQ